MSAPAESIGRTPKLAEALAKANAEISNPSFDKTNPHFKSKFASLAAVRNAVIPVYAKCGLSVIQDLQTVEHGVACFTTILHSSGEERTLGPLVITPSKNDAQGVGAAGTYAKRIALQAVACVVGDEDDDGESAVGRDTGSADIPIKKPDGYDKWKTDLAAVADEGTARLQDVWGKSDSVLRKYAAKHDLQWWEGCKERAARVPRAA